MPSTFTFYRPHGIPRNYVVEITIEHSPDETIEVSVNHNRPINCGHCGHQHPMRVNGAGTNHKITYVIGDGLHPVPMTPDDTITIEVSVPKIVPHQRLVFTATDDGFTCEAQPFKLNNKQVWQPHEIAFQQIAIIDLDKQQALLPAQQKQPVFITYDWHEPNGFTMRDLLVSPDEWHTAPKGVPTSSSIALPVKTSVVSLN